MLRLTDITKQYGKKNVLKGVSLNIEEGECVGIIGPNGSGKSTLLSIIVGALKPTSGNREVDGSIGYVPQENALIEELTVKDNLEFWAAASNKTVEQIFEMQYFKEVLGLDTMLNERVCNLSGGMKKRVNIGIALINDPQYIILDEPCSALDIIYKNEVVNYLMELKKANKSIIYTSHSGDEIEKLCDRMCILKQGTIVKESTISEIKTNYAEGTPFDEIVYGCLV